MTGIPAVRVTRGGLINVPPVRTVDQLTGEHRPSRFFRALSEADDFCREVDNVRELQTRIGELHAQIRELQEQLAVAQIERDTLRMAATT